MSKYQATWRTAMLRRFGGASVAVAVAVGMASSATAQTSPRPKHPLIVPPRSIRFGDRSLESTIRTDERYGHDGLFQGPRGWGLLALPGKPRTDSESKSVARYALDVFYRPLRHAGGQLDDPPRHVSVRKVFPIRALSMGAEHVCRLRGVAEGPRDPARFGLDQSLPRRRPIAWRRIETSPFMCWPRSRPKTPPSERRTPLYVGDNGKDLEGVIRIYLPDQDQDGAGWGPPNSSFGGQGFPAYEGQLADGTRLSAEQFVNRFAKPIVGETEKPMTVEQWVQLVNAEDNDPSLSPETAPARNPPEWERFTTIRHGVIGAFKTPSDRAKIPFGGPVEGGGEGPYPRHLSLPSLWPGLRDAGENAYLSQHLCRRGRPGRRRHADRSNAILVAGELRVRPERPGGRWSDRLSGSFRRGSQLHHCCQPT